MSIDTSLTRRQALLLSGSAAASLAAAGLPRWVHAAPSGGPSLLDPAADRGTQRRVVVLTLEKTQHRFGAGPAVPSRGISASYLGPVVRVRTGDTIPFRVENRLDEATTLHWHGLLVPSQVDGGPHNTIRPGASVVAGDSRSGSPQPRTGSIRTRMGRPPGRSTRAWPA